MQFLHMRVLIKRRKFHKVIISRSQVPQKKKNFFFEWFIPLLLYNFIVGCKFFFDRWMTFDLSRLPFNFFFRYFFFPLRIKQQISPVVLGSLRFIYFDLHNSLNLFLISSLHPEFLLTFCWRKAHSVKFNSNLNRFRRQKVWESVDAILKARWHNHKF